jgi:DNA polymerase IV (DinB-like DNA polymerase)
MDRGERLPGAPDPEERIVCHVDMDCFYAACERLREPALRGEPVVVGMGFEPGETIGAVATASYEAREYGVESAQAISTALERLPRKVDAAQDPDLDVADAGYYRPVDMAFYQSIGEDVKEILRERAAVVREVSIDEAYLDVTDRVSWDDVRAFGADLKASIVEAVGVTASVGVAPSMSAAKIASDHDKPDGLVVVSPDEVRDFLAPLDVEDVHGIGPVTAAELREMDVETAGDLAAADPDVIEDRFGERGLATWRYARGEDDRAVEPVGKPKSLSRESAFGEPTSEPERARERLRALASAVAERAARKDVLYQTIGIKVVQPPYDVNTRAESLPGPVEDPALVTEVALELFEEFVGERARKLGVRVSNLSFADEAQSSLESYEGVDEEDGSSAETRTESATGTREDGGEGAASDDAAAPTDLAGWAAAAGSAGTDERTESRRNESATLDALDERTASEDDRVAEDVWEPAAEDEASADGAQSDAAVTPSEPEPTAVEEAGDEPVKLGQLTLWDFVD